ncbi:hypothetical protein BH24PSE2_BH24PSE2_20970 [soil metagenome]
MVNKLDAGQLVRDARTQSGLTQRALARRAGTAQSVVARIERGQTSPSCETLARLLNAAGFEPRTELLPRPVANSHMLEDIARILNLTPEARLLEIHNISRFAAAARRV